MVIFHAFKKIVMRRCPNCGREITQKTIIRSRRNPICLGCGQTRVSQFIPCEYKRELYCEN